MSFLKNSILYSKNNLIIEYTYIGIIDYRIMKFIDDLTKDINKAKKINSDEKQIVLILHISSLGGYVRAGSIFIKYLETLKQENIKIITIGYKIVASMGAIIHMIGDERYLHTNTLYLIHNHRIKNLKTNKVTIPSNFKKIYKTKEYRNTIKYYMKHLSIDKKTLKKTLRQDEFLDHNKCLLYKCTLLFLNTTNSNKLMNLIDLNS